MQDDCVLDVPVVTFRIVDRIVPDVDRYDMVETDGAAEHLETIVLRRIGLDVTNRCAAADAVQCQTVEFVAVDDLEAGVFNNDVAQHAGVFGIVVAAIRTG
jgi:hypothetical protein